MTGYFEMDLFPFLLVEPAIFHSCIKNYLREGWGEIASFLLNIWHISWVGTAEQLTSHLYDQREVYSCKTFVMLVTIHAHARYSAELWLLSVHVCKIYIYCKECAIVKSPSWSDVIILRDCCMWESLSFGG